MLDTGWRIFTGFLFLIFLKTQSQKSDLKEFWHVGFLFSLAGLFPFHVIKNTIFTLCARQLLEKNQICKDCSSVCFCACLSEGQKQHADSPNSRILVKSRHHTPSTYLVLAAPPLTTYQVMMDRSNLVILPSCKMWTHCNLFVGRISEPQIPAWLPPCCDTDRGLSVSCYQGLSCRTVPGGCLGLELRDKSKTHGHLR